MRDWPPSTQRIAFGVRLHELPTSEALRSTCRRFLDGGEARTIYTPNPEILLYARQHPDYAALLNEADLALPDGFGIVFLQFLRGGRRIHKWPGVDVAELILRAAAERSLRVMFLGGREGIGDRAAARWRSELPALDVVTVGDGVAIREDGAPSRWQEETELLARIQETRPAVVFVSFGHPKQERWIERHRRTLSGVRIFMGVGGALDMWGGRRSRAPRPLRALGLEWLWRLFQEPARLPRILRATVEFPLRALTERPPRAGG